MNRDDGENPTRRRFLQTAAIGAGVSVLGGSTGLLRGLTALTQGPQPDPPTNCPAMPTGGTPFVPGSDKRPIRLRKSIAAFTPTELDTLRSAFAALRALPDGDNRRWVIQADLHALYCDSCNGNSTDIHGSWNFLPWHRAYLYYYERILGSLVGDIDNFRLPYWDWENIRQLPTAYITPSGATNSLWDSEREPVLGGGGPLDPNDGTAARIALLNSSYNFADFGGSSFAGGPIEGDPHGSVHIDVGKVPFPWHDMGDLGFAARDPVFFAHHCNIDKVWSRWNDLASGTGLPAGAYKNPSDPGFLGARWSFYDESQQTVSISAADVLNHASQLRYVYNLFKIPFKIPRFRIFKCRLICCRPGPDPAPFIQIDPAAASEILTASRARAPIQLVLRGVPIPAAARGNFDVLAVTRSRRVHVGSFGVVAHSGNHTKESVTTLILDLTGAAEQVLSREEPAGLHVVARTKEQRNNTRFLLRAREAEIRVGMR